MILPEEYLVRMQKRLGEGFPAFLRAMQEPPVRGVRANRLKISPEELKTCFPYALTPIPWAADGFYTDAEKVGKLPAHHAGLIYAQEPSAMLPAALLNAQPGERVLDLCAAPGGKTTQIAAAMQGEGVLVANEFVYSRARILSQNAERAGVVNAAVVNADPARLAAAFPAYFDKILVDAPCSGEGMFRKDAGAVAEWSAENVARCIARQKDILEAAYTMLRGGGWLVYSTCTFEEGEDEGQVRALLARHPDLRLESERLLFPHEVRGEGHYAAVLVRTAGDAREAPLFRCVKNAAAERAYRAFSEEVFLAPPHGEVTTLADGRMYLVPHGFPALPVTTLRAGRELGVFDGRRFTPAHALAMAATRDTCARFVALGEEDAARYLRGETLPCADTGWCVVGYGAYPLGWGKASGGVLKNHYPKGLRN